MSYDRNRSTFKKSKKSKKLKPLGKLKFGGGKRPLGLEVPEPKSPHKRLNRNQKISPPASPLGKRMYNSMNSMAELLAKSKRSEEKPLKPVEIIWLKDSKLSGLSDTLTNVLLEGDLIFVGLGSKGLSIWNWRESKCIKVLSNPTGLFSHRCFCLSYYAPTWLVFMEYEIGYMILELKTYTVKALLDIAVPVYPHTPVHYERIIPPRITIPSNVGYDEAKRMKAKQLPNLFVSVSSDHFTIDLFIMYKHVHHYPESDQESGQQQLYKHKKQGSIEYQGEERTGLRYPVYFERSRRLLSVTRNIKITESQGNSIIKDILILWDVSSRFEKVEYVGSRWKIRTLRSFFNPKTQTEHLITFSKEGVIAVWNMMDFSIERHIPIIRDTVSLPYMRNTYIYSANFLFLLQTQKRNRKRRHHIQILEFAKTKKKKYVKRWGKKKSPNLATRHSDILWLDESKGLMGVIFEKRLSVFKFIDRRLSKTQLYMKKERELYTIRFLLIRSNAEKYVSIFKKKDKEEFPPKEIKEESEEEEEEKQVVILKKTKKKKMMKKKKKKRRRRKSNKNVPSVQSTTEIRNFLFNSSSSSSRSTPSFNNDNDVFVDTDDSENISMLKSVEYEEFLNKKLLFRVIFVNHSHLKEILVYKFLVDVCIPTTSFFRDRSLRKVKRMRRTISYQ